MKTQCLFCCCCWLGAFWPPVWILPSVKVNTWVPRFLAKTEGFYILHNYAIFPRIRHKMSSHRSSLGGWIATVLTLVQLFSDVDTKVHFEFPSFTERFSALYTSVQLLISIDEHVSIQVSSSSEWLGTLCASVQGLCIVGSMWVFNLVWMTWNIVCNRTLSW